MQIASHDWKPAEPQSIASGSPPAGEVHLWSIDLNGDEALVQKCHALLDADERRRAAKFIPVAVRQRFIICRCTLREILAGYLDCEPERVEFRYGPYGKPALAGDSPLRFNVSHSSDLAVLAVAADVKIGMDTERIRTVENMLGLAARFFSAEESRQLQARSAEEQPEAFFSLWTCKEAFLKAHGTGLSYPLSQFTVSLGELPIVRLKEIQRDAAAAATWSLALERLDRGYLAAFAMQGSSPHSVQRLKTIPASR